MKSLISITQQSEIAEKRLLEAFPHDRGFNCFSRLWSFSMVLLVFSSCWVVYACCWILSRLHFLALFSNYFRYLWNCLSARKWAIIAMIVVVGLAGTTPEPIRKCQAKHAPLLANSRANFECICQERHHLCQLPESWEAIFECFRKYKPLS